MTGAPAGCPEFAASKMELVELDGDKTASFEKEGPLTAVGRAYRFELGAEDDSDVAPSKAAGSSLVPHSSNDLRRFKGLSFPPRRRQLSELSVTASKSIGDAAAVIRCRLGGGTLPAGVFPLWPRMASEGPAKQQQLLLLSLPCSTPKLLPRSEAALSLRAV